MDPPKSASAFSKRHDQRQASNTSNRSKPERKHHMPNPGESASVWDGASHAGSDVDMKKMDEEDNPNPEPTHDKRVRDDNMSAVLHALLSRYFWTIFLRMDA